jgi:hypothetical protein
MILAFICRLHKKQGGMCYTINCIMEDYGWTELIMCCKITRAGKKANPVLRVNPGYNG